MCLCVTGLLLLFLVCQKAVYRVYVSLAEEAHVSCCLVRAEERFQDVVGDWVDVVGFSLVVGHYRSSTRDRG